MSFFVSKLRKRHNSKERARKRIYTHEKKDKIKEERFSQRAPPKNYLLFNSICL